MKKQAFCYAVLGALTLAVQPSGAEDLPLGVVSVRYIFKLGQNGPVGGESFCHVGEDCDLNFRSDPVRLTLSAGHEGAWNEVKIDCRAIARQCVLRESDAPNSLLLEKGIRGFRILAVEYDAGNFLVWQQQIGTVTLQMQKPPPDPTPCIGFDKCRARPKLL